MAGRDWRGTEGRGMAGVAGMGPAWRDVAGSVRLGVEWPSKVRQAGHGLEQ